MYKNPEEALKKFEDERDTLLDLKKPIAKRIKQLHRNIGHIKYEMKMKESAK